MSLAYIPNNIRGNLSQQEQSAIDVLCNRGYDQIEAFFDLETGEFAGLGFTGPDGRFTRPADMIALAALQTLEDRYKKEIVMRSWGMNIWW